MQLQKRVAIAMACLLFLQVRIATAGVVIPVEPKHVVSLDGTWRFKLEQKQDATTHEEFHKTDYREGDGWHDITVPGNWEIPGFSPATYNQPDDAAGFYRFGFDVPADWNGRLVMLNFDGVQNGCEIWCNGQPVKVDMPSWGRENYHESGWTAWQADLTPAVKFGQMNLLALRVTKKTKSADADSGDYFFLGGVHRSVTLFSVPKTHMRDLTVRTKVLDGDRAELQVLIQCTGSTDGASATAQLQGFPAQRGKFGEDKPLDLSQTLDHPRLWSAESPTLYTLNVELKSADGQVIEHVSRRVGIREVSIKDGIFMVNHVPVKLVGICRHDVYPTVGTAVGPEVWKKDITMIKQANFNAIRTSHYPDGSGFYDLCDELGVYVVNEQPFCWINCDKPDEWPLFEQRVRETVARDKNHPSVVIWNVGNENPIGRNNIEAANLTAELDPSRPRLICSRPAGERGAQTDFDDRHYTTVARINEDEHDPRRAKWPHIYTENPNVWDVRNGPDFGSLDLWGQVIDRQWKEIWKDDHIVGTFLWEWSDRAVADKSPVKNYYFYSETGIHLLKTKGIVDAYREPRPDYYHCKMAQTPIVVASKAEFSTDGVTLDIANHYSFTDLKELDAHWRLIRGDKDSASGVAKMALAPRSHGNVRLALPSDTLGAADILRIDFDHPGQGENLSDGWNVVTYQFPLKPHEVPPPAVAPIESLTFPRFNFLTGTRVRDKFGWATANGFRGWWKLDRVSAKLANIALQTRTGSATTIDEAALLKTLLADARTIDADVILDGGDKSAARLHADFDGSRLTYSLKWSAKDADAYELGWEFRLPKGIDRFSWSRRAVWSYYPPGHIGRPTGTATPDSASAQLTHITRPDAFDFNSTKFDCDWVTLTDIDNKGLRVIFDPTQRQHVRGGVTADGACTLVINRTYSPPRDISSTVVPDLYTTLKRGDEVSGSFRLNTAPESR